MLTDARERGAVTLVDFPEHDELTLSIIDGLDELETSLSERSISSHQPQLEPLSAPAGVLSRLERPPPDIAVRLRLPDRGGPSQSVSAQAQPLPPWARDSALVERSVRGPPFPTVHTAIGPGGQDPSGPPGESGWLGAFP